MSNIPNANTERMANVITNIKMYTNIYDSRDNYNWIYSNPFIMGDYVYKQKIRGEHVRKFFAMTYNPGALCYKVANAIICGEKPIENDYDICLSLKQSNVEVDFNSINDAIENINTNGLNPINSLVDTSNGIRHVLEIPEFRDNLYFKTNDSKAERDWVIENFENNRYCVWRDMRERDIEYFKGWTEIEGQECELHGNFRI